MLAITSIKISLYILFRFREQTGAVCSPSARRLWLQCKENVPFSSFIFLAFSLELFVDTQSFWWSWCVHVQLEKIWVWVYCTLRFGCIMNTHVLFWFFFSLILVAKSVDKLWFCRFVFKCKVVTETHTMQVKFEFCSCSNFDTWNMEKLLMFEFFKTSRGRFEETAEIFQ